MSAGLATALVVFAVLLVSLGLDVRKQKRSQDEKTAVLYANVPAPADTGRGPDHETES